MNQQFTFDQHAKLLRASTNYHIGLKKVFFKAVKEVPPMNAPTEDFVLNAAQRAEVIAGLNQILPAHAVLHEVEDTKPYECDGLSLFRQLPMVVALPETEDQVIQILKLANRLNAN